MQAQAILCCGQAGVFGEWFVRSAPFAMFDKRLGAPGRFVEETLQQAV
jgi:hypothetical protein